MSGSSKFIPILAWLILCLALMTILFLVTKLVTSFTFARQQSRLKQHKAIINEYRAPKDLSPPEIGYLFDRRFSINELSSVLAILVSKNLVKLSVKQQINISVVSNIETHGLSFVELELLGYIRSKKHTSWDELEAELGLYSHFQKSLENQVRKQLRLSGYITEASNQAGIIRKWLRNLIGLLLSVGFVFIPLNNMIAESNFGIGNGYSGVDNAILVVIGFILSVAMLPIWSAYIDLLARIYLRGCGLPKGATKKLIDEWKDISGYRLFLEVVESDRLSIKHSAAATPWCLALGVGKSFNDIVISEYTKD